MTIADRSLSFRAALGSRVRVPGRIIGAWATVVAEEGDFIKVEGTFFRRKYSGWYRRGDVFTKAEWRRRTR